MSMKICLDPGHYGDNYNPGIAAGYVESNFTWTYSWLLKERLEKYGVEVIMTRSTKAEDLALQARGKKAAGCDLFISVHSNACDNPNQDAVTVLWSVRSGGEGIAKAIGSELTDFFKREWGDVNDLIAYSYESPKYPGYDYYGVLKGAASVGVPAIIVEHSFHTNDKYCKWAMTDGNLEKMADAEVAAIAKYYDLVRLNEDSVYHIYLSTDLKKGDKGESVKQLQMRMRQVSAEFDEEVKSHSFKNGLPDGSFGGSMVKTMQKFQQYSGIPVTGELDPQTRMVLNTSICEWHNEKVGYEAMVQDVRRIVN